MPHFKQEMNGPGITSTRNLRIFKIISWLFIGLLDYTIIYCRWKSTVERLMKSTKSKPQRGINIFVYNVSKGYWRKDMYILFSLHFVKQIYIYQFRTVETKVFDVTGILYFIHCTLLVRRVFFYKYNTQRTNEISTVLI